MGVKLGQKWAVKDGNLLASNQVGSRFFNKEFDFSRASNGTYVDRDGLLKTAELYNLMPYSEDFTQWMPRALSSVNNNIVISPSSNLNGSSLIEDNTTNFHWVQNIVSITASSTTTISVFAKAKDTRNLFIRSYDSAANIKVSQFNILNGTIISTDSGSTSEIEDYGNGWYRCSQTREDISGGGSMTCQIGILNGTSISYQGDGVSGIYIYGAQLVEGTEPLDYQYTNGRVGIPRIDFSDGVGSLLLEGQRTNVLLKSNQFDNWGTSGYNITSGQSGIYGTNDAWLIDKQDLSNSYITQVGLGFTGDFTISIYAKAGSLNKFMLYTDGKYVVYDLQNGTSQAAGAVTSHSIDYVGNGYYRCWFTGSNTNVVYIQPKASDGGFASGSIYIQHAQLESGSYPTSIIETTTTQITRLADVCNNSGSAQDFNSEGVLYAEIAGLTDGGEVRRISINDGSTNNRVIIELDSTTNRVRAFSVTSGATQAILVDYLTDSTQFAKIAIKYKENDFALWVNGVEESTDLSGSVPIGLNKLSFNDGSTNNFYGKVRNLQVFTEALSDEELQQLTT